MKLSDRKHKLTCFVIMTLVLIKMGLYWPNFSLLFLIHLFLYAGVYCTTVEPLYNGHLGDRRKWLLYRLSRSPSLLISGSGSWPQRKELLGHSAKDF